MTRRHWLIAAVVFCAAAAAVPAWTAWSGSRASGMPVTAPAAFVNGRAIGQDDLDARLNQILPLASYHGGVEPVRLMGFRRAALDELILDELIYQRATARGAAADDSEIERAVEQARGGFASADEFQQALAEVGMTERDFRQRLARLAIIRRERSAHEGHEPTEAEVRSYFDRNGAKFERPEQVHLFEMLIAVDPANQSAASDAERRANAIAARLRRGEAFGPLAREHSDDDYRVKGGDFGLVHRGRLATELDEAVFAAATGEVTVARTIYGFHVFRVTERVPPARLSYAEARPNVLERLRRQFHDDDVQKFRRELLAGAHIEIVDAALREATPLEIPDLRIPKAGRSLSGDRVSARRVDAVS